MESRRKSRIIVFATALILFLILSLNGTNSLPLVTSVNPTPIMSTANSTPLKHIIMVIQENHSFDVYFGRFPGLKSPYQLSLTVCLPLQSGSPTPCLKPWRADSVSTTVQSQDLAHGWPNAITAYDNGKMDGFIYAQNEPYRNDVMAYFTNYTVPDYWDYASYFGLDANFFTSFKGPSEPNHLYAFAAKAEGIKNPVLFNLSFTPLASELTNAKIDWKAYAGGWSDSIDCVHPLNSTYLSTHAPAFAPMFGVLTQFPKIQANPATCHNLLSLNDFFANVSKGYLPKVAWVLPGGGDASEHPGGAGGILHGQEYVSSLVNAVESNSALYNSTAIFIAWDDFGGYYDSIPPVTQVDGLGYGFRTGLLIISPYVIRGINYGCGGRQADFTAFLKTAEYLYGLKNLTDRDGSTYPLTCLFNFSKPPIPPLFMPMGELGIYPWQSCVKIGLCSVGYKAAASYRVESIFQSIPQDSGPNDED